MLNRSLRYSFSWRFDSSLGDYGKILRGENRRNRVGSYISHHQIADPPCQSPAVLRLKGPVASIFVRVGSNFVV